MDKKKYNVYLGRFCPLHIGHQAIIDKIILKHGKENLLIMVGSSTSYNERTPYIYEQRVEMIKSLYPDISTVGLPDTEPGRKFFREDTATVWLNSIKAIENKMNAEFTFYGGSIEDLEMLSRKFKTEVIVDRNFSSEKISATKVREAFDNNDIESAKRMVDEKVFDIAFNGYEKYKRI